MADVRNDRSPRTWRSGAWSLELRDDEFTDISYRDRNVLRSVQAVVSGGDGESARLVVDRIDESDLALTLHVHSEGAGSDLRGIVRAETRGSDRLRLLADLESATAFQTQGTGLVLVHPPGDEDLDISLRFSGQPSERQRQRGTDASDRTRPEAPQVPYTIEVGGRIVETIDVAVAIRG